MLLLRIKLDAEWNERNIHIIIAILKCTNSFNSQSNIAKLVLMLSSCTKGEIGMNLRNVYKVTWSESSRAKEDWNDA